MIDSKVGLCIAGCGSFARAHAQVASERRERIALFFASRSKEKAAAYAKEYGASDAFGSYEEAARDSRVDALLFCTPHSLHLQNLELAAAHHKHVLMEKPIATTLDDAHAMKARAQRAGIQLMVAENYRYMPAFRAAANLIQQGAIGPLRAIHLQTTNYQRSKGWRLSREMMGGGALIDGGIHKVTTLRMLAGDPLVISAVTPANVFPEMEGEEAISLWATFAEGVVGTLNYSWAALGEPGTESFLALGSEGHIQLDFYRSCLRFQTLTKEETLTFDSDLAGLGAMLDAFLGLVLRGQPPATPPEEAIGDLRFVLAAYASANSGGYPVRLENSL